MGLRAIFRRRGSSHSAEIGSGSSAQLQVDAPPGVVLHWPDGGLPAFVEPLLGALKELGGDPGTGSTELKPESDPTIICPNAIAVPPPDIDGRLLVFALESDGLFHDDLYEQITGPLIPWAERGAEFFTATPTAARELASRLDISPSRVHAVQVPLPGASRIPEPTPIKSDGDVLVVDPIEYSLVLPTMQAICYRDPKRHVVLAAADCSPFTEPGGAAGLWNLLPGYSAIGAEDWRDHVNDAAVIVFCNSVPGNGWVMREALASGRPVVLTNMPVVREHLRALGADAYWFRDNTDVAGLTGAILDALELTRRRELQAAARAAVLNEPWEPAARKLREVIRGHSAPAQAAWPRPRGTTHGADSGLRIAVINARYIGGGSGRFTGELVRAMCRSDEVSYVKVIYAVEEELSFELETDALASVGADVVVAARQRLDEVLEEELRDVDVVYYSWPHLGEPPNTSVPLVCTFHDANWKHFDVYKPEQKEELDRQSSAWIKRCQTVVCSSQFIRGEIERFFDASAEQVKVVPLTAWSDHSQATAEEKEAVRRKFALPSKFLLSPAGFWYHKNYPLLTEAMRLLRDQGRPANVVATGDATHLYYRGPDVIGLGYVTSKELGVLYDLCTGIVQTTLYEAGSFPMFEAMSLRKPVAISRIPSIMEQLERQDTVAELFDPLSPEECASAISRLLEGDPATDAEVLERNARNVASRTWDDVATEYIAVFRNVKETSGAAVR